MIEKKSIPLSSIQRNLPDRTATDGSMQDMLNFRIKDGALRLIPKDEEAFTITSPEEEVGGVFIHLLRGGKKNLILWTKVAGQSNLYLYASKENGSSFVQMGSPVNIDTLNGEISSVCDNANIIGVSYKDAESVKTKFYYYSDSDQQYKVYISATSENSPFDINIEIDRHVEGSDGVSKFSDNYIGILGKEELFYRAYLDSDSIDYGKPFLKSYTKDELPTDGSLYIPDLSKVDVSVPEQDMKNFNIPTKIISELKMQRESFLNEKLSGDTYGERIKGKHLLIATVNDLNGTPITASQPILIDGGMEAAPVIMVFPEKMKKDGDYGTINMMASDSGYCFHVGLTPRMATKYDIKINIQGDKEAIRDVISGISIYMTKEIDPYSNGSVNYANSPIFGYNEMPNVVDDSRHFLYPFFLFSFLPKNKQEWDEELKHSAFYESITFTTDEIISGKVKNPRRVSETDLPLDIGSVYYNENESIGDKLFSFNTRYHYFGSNTFSSKSSLPEAYAFSIRNTETEDKDSSTVNYNDEVWKCMKYNWAVIDNVPRPNTVTTEEKKSDEWDLDTYSITDKLINNAISGNYKPSCFLFRSDLEFGLLGKANGEEMEYFYQIHRKSGKIENTSVNTIAEGCVPPFFFLDTNTSNKALYIDLFIKKKESSTAYSFCKRRIYGSVIDAGYTLFYNLSGYEDLYSFKESSKQSILNFTKCDKPEDESRLSKLRVMNHLIVYRTTYKDAAFLTPFTSRIEIPYTNMRYKDGLDTGSEELMIALSIRKIEDANGDVEAYKNYPTKYQIRDVKSSEVMMDPLDVENVYVYFKDRTYPYGTTELVNGNVEYVDGNIPPGYYDAGADASAYRIEPYGTYIHKGNRTLMNPRVYYYNENIWAEISEDDYEKAQTIQETEESISDTSGNLIVSDSYAPYSVRLSNIYSVGKGNILALSSGTGDISAGTKYGAFPLYAFCTDGIYIIGLSGSTEVVYDQITLVSGLVCTAPESVTACRDGVAFLTEKGLMYISGQNVEEISTQIEGEDSGFMEEAKESKFAYNGTDNELVVWPDGKEYAYIYQFGNKSWTKREINGARFVNDYPSIYVQDVQEEESLMRFFDITREGDASIRNVYFETRPIKFGTESFKRIKKLVMKCNLEVEDGCDITMLVEVSNDGNSWKQIGGNRKKDKAGRIYDMGALFAGNPYRYYRVKFEGTLKNAEITSFESQINAGNKINIS